MLFQKNIVKKYIATLNDDVEAAWNQYKSYFLNAAIQANIRQSKEEQFQEGFLRELFVKVLGYTLNPSPNFNLITEQKNETNSQKADGAILLDGNVIGVIELKDHKTTDLSKIEKQAFGYKSQHRDARYVIISNFEKLRLYIDNAVDFREWSLFTMTFDEFREMYLCIAWNQMKNGIALKIKSESVSSEDQITNALYKDYSQFKRSLFADILKNNPAPENKNESDWQLLLFKKTQKLLDRLLFIFFAEDCGLLPPNSMVEIIKQWRQLKELDEYKPLYDRIKKYFGYLDTGHQGKHYEIFAYNSGLFKPDEVLDNLRISDEVLEEPTIKLASYDFESDVDVNILGHIFENSLSEIEEITQQITNGEIPKTSKRKQDGVFYTPQYITKYIVENTVGKLCAEKKAELGIVEEDYFSDQKRQKQTKIKLIEQLSQYRELLLQITICDPACGSGAFLNAALQFLIAEHKLIDEMEAKVAGESLVFPNVENSILENNLFGVDINEESVEIAQLALWLRTAKPHRKLNTLSQNIKCGNSLISDPAVAGDKAFDWQKEFPKVFEKGGFDVVIGNPPYLRVQGLRENFEKESIFYEQHYSSATERFDFYVLFMERAFSLLNQNGLMTFILPHKFINAGFGIGIRKFIYANKALKSLIHFGAEQVFEDASVYTCIIGLSKCHNHEFEFAKVAPKDLSNSFDTENIPEDRLSDSNNWNISLENDARMLDKLKKMPFRVKDVFKGIFQGIVSGDNKAFYLYDCIEKEKCIEGFSQVLNSRILIESDICKPIFTGKTISRYNFIDKKEFLIYPYHMQNGKTVFYNETELEKNYPKCFEYFQSIKDRLENRGTASMSYPIWYALWNARSIQNLSAKKIFTPDICFGSSMCFDDVGRLHNDTSYGLILKAPCDEVYKAFLAIFNSKITWYFLTKTGTELRGGYFRFKTKYLEPFPLPDLTSLENKVYSDSLAVLADKMLFLNSQLQQKRSRFLRRLQDNFEGVKITSALESFDTMEFAEFLKELKKQKITLSLSQQDEWEEYFNQYKTECNNLSAEITTTDNAIDFKVYKLYGLTYDEVLVVDKDTKITREEYEK